jgi:hypothetical protein
MTIKTLLYFFPLFFPLLILAQGIDVHSGTSVTVGSGTNIIITGGGNLTLRDDADHAPSLLCRGSISLPDPGESRVEQFLAKDEWHIVSSPMTDAEISSYLWMYLYKYDESTNLFEDLNKPITQVLDPGRGYFLWNPSAGDNGYITPPETAIITGSLNSTTITVSLEITPGAPYEGYNLIGNPFPCALDWNDSPDWQRINVDATISIYDYGAGGGGGNYRQYNYYTGIGIPAGNNGHIASTQGFWLRASDDGASISLPASQRLHSSVPFYKEMENERANTLRIRVDQHSSGHFCETVIGFDESSTGGFDGLFDAEFLEGKAEAPALFSYIDGTLYSMNFMPAWQDFPVVPVSFNAAANDEFQLSVTGTDGFPDNIPIYIEDKLLGVFQDLRAENTYTYAHDPTMAHKRFNIHFAAQEDEQENDQVFESQVSIYAYGKNIYVDIPENIRGEVSVFDLMGKRVTRQMTDVGLNKIPTHLNNTYTTVMFISSTHSVVKKVFIR